MNWSLSSLRQRLIETIDRQAPDDRPLTLALCAASGFFFLWLLSPILRGRTFIAGDLLSFYLPNRKFYADCLRNRESFLWSPFLFGGFYAHGEGQVGMMHPFHMLLYYLLPLTTAFGVEILSSYVFLFAGCWFLFKGWNLATPAALLGSLLFTFGGTNLILLEHMDAIAVVAHLPWVLLAIHRAFDSPNPRTRAHWLSAIAMLTGSQVLLGYPQYLYFCALLEGAYIVYLMTVKARWPRLLEAVVALAVGLAIGGAQLLPTMTAVRESVRSAPRIDFLSQMSLHPLELLQWINPLLWNGGRYNQLRVFYNLFIYCGGIVALLLFVWILTRKDLDGTRRKLARLLGVIAFASLFLALGKYNLLFPLYARLPVLGLFRGPARYTVLTDFAVAAGTALAWDHLRAVGGQLSLSPLARRLAMFLAVGSMATVALAFLPALTEQTGLMLDVSALTPHLASPKLAVVGALMVVSGIVLFLSVARMPRISCSALAMFVLLDVVCLQGAVLFVHNKTGDPFQADTPPVEAPGPVQSRAGDQLALLDYRLVDGYTGLQPASPIPMGSTVYARIMGARAVRENGWRVLPDPLPLLRLRNRAVLMMNRDALLADSDLLAQSVLMDTPIAIPDLYRDLDQVSHFDFANAALVEAGVSLDPAASGSLSLVEEHPGRLTLTAKVTGAMLATAGVRFHPGWKLLLDGKPAETVRVDGSMLGFIVPAGSHRIEARFDPDDFRYGEMVSSAGLLATILYLAIVFFRSKGAAQFGSAR